MKPAVADKKPLGQRRRASGHADPKLPKRRVERTVEIKRVRTLIKVIAVKAPRPRSAAERRCRLEESDTRAALRGEPCSDKTSNTTTDNDHIERTHALPPQRRRQNRPMVCFNRHVSLRQRVQRQFQQIVSWMRFSARR